MVERLFSVYNIQCTHKNVYIVQSGVTLSEVHVFVNTSCCIRHVQKGFSAGFQQHTHLVHQFQH